MRIFDRDLSAAKEWLAGTHRVRAPAETLRDYGRLMRPAGITRIANVTGLDRIGLPVYVAIRPNSRSLSTSQGKGLEPDLARASALMESLETWHAERIEAPLRHESYEALADRAPAVDPRELPLHASSVVRVDVPIFWIEGWDLVREERCWVPYEFVSLNCVYPPGAVLTFSTTSTGLSSGNHILEAVAHALAEGIERDALALWTLGAAAERKAQQIDLATVGDAACRKALEIVERAGVHVGAWDMTSDVGVPAHAAVVLDRTVQPDAGALNACAGYGCHLDPGVSLLRAICEAVQSRVTLITGSRDDFVHRDYADSRNEDDQRRLLHEMLEPPPARRFDERPSLAGRTFEEDVATLVAALRRAGIERAVVVDLSRPEIGVPVVKVVVPGLEGPSTVATYSPGERARAKLAALGGAA